MNKLELEQKALTLLRMSLSSLPCEINEMVLGPESLKSRLSLARSISALSNSVGGGFLVFGINEKGEKIGVDKGTGGGILNTVYSISVNFLEPQAAFSEFFSNIDGVDILFVYIHESHLRSVHIRSEGKGESYVRSKGKTVKKTNSYERD